MPPAYTVQGAVVLCCVSCFQKMSEGWRYHRTLQYLTVSHIKLSGTGSLADRSKCSLYWLERNCTVEQHPEHAWVRDEPIFWNRKRRKLFTRHTSQHFVPSMYYVFVLCSSHENRARSATTTEEVPPSETRSKRPPPMAAAAAASGGNGRPSLASPAQAAPAAKRLPPVRVT